MSTVRLVFLFSGWQSWLKSAFHCYVVIIVKRSSDQISVGTFLVFPSFMKLFYCHQLIPAEVYIYIQDTYRGNDKDAGRLLYKNMYRSLYCKGSKRFTQGLRVRGSWRPNRTEIFWPLLLWPSTLCLSHSPDAQPEALGSTLLGAVFLYCILSASSLDSNSSGPQAPSAWYGFPYHISLQLALELNCLEFCLDWVI